MKSASWELKIMHYLIVFWLFLFLFVPEMAGGEEIPVSNSSIQRKIQLKTVIVADYYPYTFVNKEGVPDGFSVDLVNAVAKVMGMDLEIKVDTWERAMRHLETGEIDLLPMMAYSIERDKVFDFSAPHTIAFDAFFTRKDSKRPSTVEDFKGQTLIVMKGDQAHDYLLSSGFVNSEHLILIDSLPEALRLLSSGKADAALMPKLVGLMVMNDLNLTNLTQSPVVVESFNRPFSFAVKEGNLLLLERLGQGLSIVKNTGQYREIYDKWFGPLEPKELTLKSVLKYIVGLLLALLLIGSAFALWSFSLKKQVALRTKKLTDEIVERKIAEMRFRQVTETIREVFWLGSLDWKEVYYVSPAYEHVWGRTCEELYQNPLSWFESVVEEDRQKVMTTIPEVISTDTREIVFPDYRIRRSDGSVAWISARAFPVLDFSGRPYRIAGIAEDISMRKQADAVLRESEEKHSLLLEESPDPFFSFTPEGHYTYVNRAFAEGVRKPVEDIVGKRIWDVFPKEEADKRFAFLSQVFRTGKEKVIEVCVPLTDGDRYYMTTITPIKDTEGDVVSAICSSKDITDRKRAEEALGQSEEMFRVMVETFPLAIVLTIGIEQRSEYLNPKFIELFGYTLEDIPTIKHWWPLAYPDETYRRQISEEWTARIECAIETQSQIEPMEVVVTCKDGSKKNISWAFITLGDKNYSCGLDLTERKQAEAELQKMRKLQSVGTLAGGIAHDFNNILMGVYGNLSLAKEGLSEEHPRFRFLNEAEKSMNRAIRLTKQLLTFAKGGAPVKEDVSLGALVEEVARFDLSGSNVMLVHNQVEDLWPAKVDKGQMQQVISNLTINASQAMPNGGHLYITLENAVITEADVSGLPQGKYVRITVRDVGTGIDQNHLDRIFDPYFTTKQAGSGLGLATTYSIINKHGGHIGVDSELGKGTTFTLFLPASEFPQPTESQKCSAECLILEQTARILVMDDDEMVRNIATEMLNIIGFSVETAVDGKQAFEMYKQALEAGELFAVVIMDLTIPGGIGGKEAIKEILAIDPDAKVIVSSGYADDPVMAHFADYGFKGIAAKPYTLRTLQEVLGQVMK